VSLCAITHLLFLTRVELCVVAEALTFSTLLLRINKSCDQLICDEPLKVKGSLIKGHATAVGSISCGGQSYISVTN